MITQVEAIGFVEANRMQAEDDYWGGEESCITLTEHYAPEALQGVTDFSHVEVLFLFHKVDPAKIVEGARHPRNNKDWPAVGIFAQRGKNRPNRIGSTICRVIRCEGRKLFVAELDAIHGTPVLDIKPVMTQFLPREAVRQPSWSHELMQHYWRNATTEKSADMEVYGIDHVQLAMPAGKEAIAREFYGELLGLTELPKPANLASRGGVWFQCGSLQLHLGVEAEFRSAKKAHPALLVKGLSLLLSKLAESGYDVKSDEPLANFNRAFTSDPFGNRIELLEPSV